MVKHPCESIAEAEKIWKSSQPRKKYYETRNTHDKPTKKGGNQQIKNRVDKETNIMTTKQKKSTAQNTYGN